MTQDADSELARLREFLEFIAKDEHSHPPPHYVLIDECSCQPWCNKQLAEAALEGLTLGEAKERCRQDR